MGMYTEFVMAVKLDRDTPKDVIDILKYMCDRRLEEPENLPDHPLFKTKRWSALLCCDSAYFVGETNSYIRCTDFYKDLSCRYLLMIRSDLKNYDSEIELFLDWITPYVVDPVDECAGYFRYEEFDDPTLIYFNHVNELGKVVPCGLLRVRVGSESRIEPLEKFFAA